jgi:hypothetical protein
LAAVIVAVLHTCPGWLLVSWQMAAVRMLAVPSMFCAVWFDGSARLPAIAYMD